MKKVRFFSLRPSECGATVAQVFWKHEVAGSNPVTQTILYWSIAQPGLERQSDKLKVVGSNPTTPTNFYIADVV